MTCYSGSTENLGRISDRSPFSLQEVARGGEEDGPDFMASGCIRARLEGFVAAHYRRVDVERYGTCVGFQRLPGNA